MIDIVATFRALPAEEQRRIRAELSKGRRGRPAKSYEAELADTMALIDRVESKAAELGNPGERIPKEVFMTLEPLPSRRPKWESIRTDYHRAKHLQRVIARWVDAHRKMAETIIVGLKSD